MSNLLKLELQMTVSHRGWDLTGFLKEQPVLMTIGHFINSQCYDCWAISLSYCLEFHFYFIMCIISIGVLCTYGRFYTQGDQTKIILEDTCSRQPFCLEPITRSPTKLVSNHFPQLLPFFYLRRDCFIRL